jgi:hypothetical protein
MTTVREMVDALTAAAAELPNGLDTDVELGTCDGQALRLVESVDVSPWAEVDGTGNAAPFVLLRTHAHPGDDAGELLRPVAAEADRHLRLWATGGT